MSTKSFTLSNGATLDVMTFTGEVLESTKTRHTTVHQDRAAVGANVVVPGQVYSEVHTEHEVWLRDARGEERAIDFGDLDIPIRVGHQVSVFYAGMQKASSKKLVMIRNHTTNDWILETKLRDFLKANASDLGKHALHIWGVPIAILIGAAVLSLKPMLGQISNSVSALGIALAPTYFVIMAFIFSKQDRSLDEELSALMKSLAQT